jgi:hypothetical protein
MLDGVVTDDEVPGGGAGDVRAPVLVAVDEDSALGGGGGDGGQAFHGALDGGGVGGIEGAGAASSHAGGAATVRAGRHGEHVVSHGRDAGGDRGGGAPADAHEGNDGADADHHAEHSEGRTHQVAPYLADGHQDRGEEHAEGGLVPAVRGWALGA